MNPSPGDPEQTLSYQGWRVLFASVIGLALSPGPMIFGSLGQLAPHIDSQFGWSLGQLMLSLTVFNIAGVIAAPFTGRLIDRLGVRAVLFPSLIASAAGFVGLAYLVQTRTALYVLAFAWGALTVGTQSISYTKLLTLWFERRRGLAVGIAAAGLGLGYTLVPLLIAQLLTRLSWQATLMVMALIVLIVPTSINALFAHPKARDSDAPGSMIPGLSLRDARRTRAFWYMTCAIFLASTALTGVVPHLTLLTIDRGFTAREGALVAATYGLSTILGRLLVGILADRFFIPRVAMLFFGVSAAGFAWAGLVGSHPSLLVLALIALTVGFGFGAESDIIALLISRYFGQRSFGAIYGVLLAVFLIGASLGPPLFGFGRDALGTYQPLMLAAAVVMIGAILLLARLGRYPAEFATRASGE